MRRWRTAWWLAALLAAAVAAGCLPNRVAISPDGRTMYFSLGPQGPFGGGGGLSNIYSLQIETAEMQALTDGPGAKTWCMPTDGAKRLAYMELPVAAGERAIRLLDLETGQDIPLTGALQPHMYPWAIPDREPRLLAIREGADAEPYWALYGEKGLMALPLPEGAKARRLSGDNLMALKYAADLKRGIARTLCVSEGECPEALAEKLKPVLDPLGQIVKSGDDAFEQAQQAAAVWEEVPAVPEIEAPAAAAPAAEKPAEEPAAP